MSKFWTWLLVVAVACVLSVGTAGAQEKKGGKGKHASVEDRFKALDTNGDSKLSLEEFTAGKDGKHKEMAEKLFSQFAKDGSLTLDQYKALLEKVRELREKHGKGAKDKDPNNSSSNNSNSTK